MHQIAQEIINSFEIRKTKQQKQQFLNFMSEQMKEQGYDVTIEITGSMKSRNLVLGNPETADIVLTAHYDTCAWMPFPNMIMPSHPVGSFLYQMFACVMLFACCYLLSIILFALIHIPAYYALGLSTTLFGLSLIQLLVGFANPHTMNDNTSGVVQLTEIACELPKSLYDRVAFIFFDHEEIGMVGSRGYAKAHRDAIKDIPILNFDCIGDGKDIFIYYSKRAGEKEALIRSMEESITHQGEYQVHIASDHHKLYPSDQKSFPVAAAVFAAQKHPFWGYHLRYLHTHKDQILDEGNVEYLKAHILSFILTYIGRKEEVKESK